MNALIDKQYCLRTCLLLELEALALPNPYPSGALLKSQGHNGTR